MEYHGLGKIKWPALSLGSPNCSMDRHNSAERFSALSSSGLRGFAALNEHFIIDSTGARFDLSKPEFVESLLLVQRVMSWLRRSEHPVRWKCTYRDKVDVADLKRMIEEDWKLYVSMWQATDLDELEKRLAAAGSLAEVIAVFD